MLKSQYFKSYTMSDGVKKNIGKLAELSDETLDKLATWFEAQTCYPQFDFLERKTLSDETGESAETIRSAMNASIILLKRMGELADTPENLVADAIALNILPQPSLKIVTFLKRLAPKSKDYLLFSRIQEVAKGGIPNLLHVSMTVAAKPIYDKDFTYGTDSIAEYDPSLVDYVVVAHISLENDNAPGACSFQLSQKDLDRFITDLLVLQKQMVMTEIKVKAITSKR